MENDEQQIKYVDVEGFKIPEGLMPLHGIAYVRCLDKEGQPNDQFVVLGDPNPLEVIGIGHFIREEWTLMLRHVIHGRDA